MLKSNVCAIFVLLTGQTFGAATETGHGAQDRLGFTALDISTCRRGIAISTWPALPTSSTPFPQRPPPAVSADGFENTQEIARSKKRRHSPQPEDQHRSVSTRSTHKDFCELVRTMRFEKLSGYVRLETVPLESMDSRYWISWGTDFNATGQVMLSAQPGGGPAWKLLYSSPDEGESKAAIEIVDFYIGTHVAVDLHLSDGNGNGTSGEVALFRVSSPPPSGP